MKWTEYIWRRGKYQGERVLFNWLMLIAHSFPWQESDEHKSWRRFAAEWTRASKTPYPITEPRYSIGLKKSGHRFERELGIKFTWRGVRLDLLIGILWINWAGWKKYEASGPVG